MIFLKKYFFLLFLLFTIIKYVYSEVDNFETMGNHVTGSKEETSTEPNGINI